MSAPAVHFEAPGVTLWHGDCIETMRLLPDESVDAVVTDPPYGLSATDSKHVVEALSHWLAGDREFLPAAGGGFMGNAWDAFVPPVAVWDEAFRVLKPGGHVLAFAGSRTQDLMGLAIRLAGFDLRDSIAWLYGSGMPKSMDVAQAIDKRDAAGERLDRARSFQSWLRPLITPRRIDELTGTNMGHHLTTHPTQPAVATAELFDLLRPELPTVPDSIEELVAERTVESKNYAQREVVGQYKSAIARGAAGVTAAGEGKPKTATFTPEGRAWEGWGTALKPAFEPVIVARKPFVGTVATNVLTHGTGALNIDASRVVTSDKLGGGAEKITAAGQRHEGWVRPWMDDPQQQEAHAGRVRANVEKAEDLGRWPTNVLLDSSQAEALDAQTGTLTSGKLEAHHARSPKGAGILGAYGSAEGARGYGDSGGASRFFPTFRYEAKAGGAERPSVDGMQHPTVKPLALMEWLIRLVTPPGGTVLEPFAGSGTTLEAAVREGFTVIGIEREADYLPLIVHRLMERDHQQSLFGEWEA